MNGAEAEGGRLLFGCTTGKHQAILNASLPSSRRVAQMCRGLACDKLPPILGTRFRQATSEEPNMRRHQKKGGTVRVFLTVGFSLMTNPQ